MTHVVIEPFCVSKEPSVSLAQTYIFLVVNYFNKGGAGTHGNLGELRFWQNSKKVWQDVHTCGLLCQLVGYTHSTPKCVVIVLPKYQAMSCVIMSHYYCVVVIHLAVIRHYQ